MARERYRDLTLGDVERARQVFSRFGPVLERNVPVWSRRNLLKMRYVPGVDEFGHPKPLEINGVLVDTMSARQVYAASNSVHRGCVNLFSSPETPILEGILALKAMEAGDDRDGVDERVCIQLADFPEDHYLNRLYGQAKHQ